MYQSWRYVQCALCWKNQHNVKTVNVVTQIFDRFVKQVCLEILRCFSESISMKVSDIMSFYVLTCPFLSLLVLFRPYLSFYVLTCPFLSLLVLFRPYLSFYVLTCPFLSLLVLFRPYLSFYVLTCPFLSLLVLFFLVLLCPIIIPVMKIM